MALNRVERERITDSRIKLQAVAEALNHLSPEKVPDFAKIQECLDDATRSFDGALQQAGSSPK